MKLVARYSFNNGEKIITGNFPSEYSEVLDVIKHLDASSCKTKVSKEKTMPGEVLYSPIAMNNEFKKLFAVKGWEKVRIVVNTNVPELGPSHKHTGFREMDFVKNKLGVEVQFGKYAFMVYNVAAKMTIFSRQDKIKAGIEIVPMLSLANHMSSGVSYFEQMKTDLEMRGVSNIDIPVLILGVDDAGKSTQKTRRVSL